MIEDPPDTKRVRRRDLATPPSSRATSSSPPPQAALTEHFHTLYGPPPETAPAGISRPPQVPAEPKSESYAFRLFARPGADRTRSPPRIRVASPTPESTEPGFLPPRTRPSTYYFTPPATPESRTHFRDAAVSGEEVQRQSLVWCPGCALPWRVRTVVAPKDGDVRAEGNSIVHVGGRGDKAATGRKKPGKKRRIVLRLRARLEAEARAEEAERQETRQKAAQDAHSDAVKPMDEEEQVAAEKRARKNQARKERRKAIKVAQKTGAVG